MFCFDCTAIADVARSAVILVTAIRLTQGERRLLRRHARKAALRKGLSLRELKARRSSETDLVSADASMAFGSNEPREKKGTSP